MRSTMHILARSKYRIAEQGNPADRYAPADFFVSSGNYKPMNDIDLILEFIKVKRKYASFFEWFKREKSIKELGVVRTLIESLSGGGFVVYQNLRPSTNDPPDVLAETTDGSLVGFEVRELVDQKVVELNEKGVAVYRDWSHSEVVQELHKIISEKDSKI